MSVESAVQSGADAMAAAEAHLSNARDQILLVPASIREVQLAGNIGYLERQALSMRAHALAGAVALVSQQVFEFHQDLTARCQELGIDLPPPPEGEISPRSGGGGR